MQSEGLIEESLGGAWLPTFTRRPTEMDRSQNGEHHSTRTGGPGKSRSPP